ncbi:hypothetical protein BDV96DRAFT_627187 [Lophiotrema nucula]|uniref:BTB domain-containing protein n=1 Tax=Lophiotrema nucula TaxID=690887 RepID=A0A6A5ZSF2_9PLEO|nr:hypothetical protein BDV96DRAFT_627187 [Lophiotrema nucula]
MASSEEATEKNNNAFDLTRTVKIRAGQGDTQKDYLIHDGLLQRSEFFKRALRGDWKEAEKRTIELSEDEPAVVERYLQSLYVRTISLNKEPNPLEYEESRRRCNDECRKLAKLYVFAEKVQDTRIKNLTLVAIMDLVENGLPNGKLLPPSSSMVSNIYKYTVGGNIARKFLVDFYVCFGQARWFDAGETTLWPVDFLLELSRALFEMRGPPRKDVKDMPLATKHDYREEECRHTDEANESIDQPLQKPSADGTSEPTNLSICLS